MKFIDPFYFLLSLSISILIVYLFTNQPKIIMKYPTPDTTNDTIYKDKNNVCYKYTHKEVSCKNNNVKNIELQNGSNPNFINLIKNKLNFN